jgi:integrase
VRITAAGVVAFILNYRIVGRERRYTIGRYPELSADAARNEALELRAKIRKGVDPLQERDSSRTEPLVSDLAHDYIERHALPHKRPGSIRNDRQMLDRIVLPRLGRHRVSAITRRDVQALHNSRKATPYHANRVLSLLSKMFALAIEWGWRDDNPAEGVERFHEDRRERWLTKDELARLETALREYPDLETADALRLLILTGARSGELLKAEWPQFDLERGTWTKPSHHTKQNKIETVPLNRAAIAILTDLFERPRSNYVFPGREQGSRVTLRRPWIQVLKAAGLTTAEQVPGKHGRMLTRHKPTVRIHDLRHTFASHLVSSGQSLHIVGKLLGHTLPSTTARYAHLDDKALRASTNVVGNLLSGKKATR